MRKLTIRFATAFFTFVIGVVSASLWIAQHYRSSETVPPLSAPAVHEPKSNIPQGWQKMNVAGKVSFYLPPDMKETELIGDYSGPAKAFSNKILRINYVYYDGLSCETNAALAKRAAFQSCEVEIGGRKAKQVFWQSDKPTWVFMTLCFSDIDNVGTGLHLGAVAKDQQSLEVAKQIFGSIEFP